MNVKSQHKLAIERFDGVAESPNETLESFADDSEEPSKRQSQSDTMPCLVVPVAYTSRHRRVHIRGEGDLVRYVGGSAGICKIIREAGGDPAAYVVSVAPTTETRSGHLFSVHVESIATDRGATYLADARARWLSQLRQDLVRGRFAAR
jgi:hypothetical protein